MFDLNTNIITSPVTIPNLKSLETHNTTPIPALTATMSDTVTDTGVIVDQPSLSIAQAPSFCRLCNVELRGLQTWRAHVKSDGQ